LGLKLKAGASEESPAVHAASAHQQPNSTGSSIHAADVSARSSNNKRRQVPSASYPAPDHTAANKRPRRDDTYESSPALKRQKSVSFADGTKAGEQIAAVGETPTPKKPKKQKKKKKPKPSAKESKPLSLEPSLEYLRQWHNARESWKFNKNHQTLLIKSVFDGTAIPSTDIDTFYLYIRDLKGFVRTRLLETAREIGKKDMEQGSAGFLEGTNEVEVKQQQYDEIINRLLQVQHDGNGSSSSNSTATKRKFDELAFLMQQADEEVKQRVLKRMRAELIADELSESGESSRSGGTTMSSSESSESAGRGVGDATTEKRVKLNDGSQQKVKRRRKMRTGVDDDSSDSDSDESSSSRSSSSSSSGSSDDESEDDEMELAPGNAAFETSSSSSSSSSSGSGSESASDSDGDESDEDRESENDDD
jgi:hypothetical protein